MVTVKLLKSFLILFYSKHTLDSLNAHIIPLVMNRLSETYPRPKYHSAQTIRMMNDIEWMVYSGGISHDNTNGEKK